MLSIQGFSIIFPKEIFHSEAISYGASRISYSEGIFHSPSRFPHKLFLTPGAGDGDLAFATGNPDGLPAAGTGEVAMLAVLDPVQKH